MSCEACNDIQEGRAGYPGGGPVYVRVGTGNVEIVGCRQHQRQLIEQLRGMSTERIDPCETPSSG